jgi:hypothetical protein
MGQLNLAAQDADGTIGWAPLIQDFIPRFISSFVDVGDQTEELFFPLSIKALKVGDLLEERENVFWVHCMYDPVLVTKRFCATHGCCRRF